MPGNSQKLSFFVFPAVRLLAHISESNYGPTLKGNFGEITRWDWPGDCRKHLQIGWSVVVLCGQNGVRSCVRYTVRTLIGYGMFAESTSTSCVVHSDVNELQSHGSVRGHPSHIDVLREGRSGTVQEYGVRSHTILRASGRCTRRRKPHDDQRGEYGEEPDNWWDWHGRSCSFLKVCNRAPQ